MRGMFASLVWRSPWLMALLLAVLSSHALGNQTIWLTSIEPFTGADWDAGISMRIGAEIMLEEIKRKQSLLPGFDLKVVWQDGLCSKGVGTDIFLRNVFKGEYDVFAPGHSIEQLNVDGDSTIETADTAPLGEIWNSTRVDPAPVGLLGPGCAGTAININKIAYMTNFPVVSNSATRPGLSDRTNFPNFWRTILPDTFFNAAWVAMAKLLGHSSITAVTGETQNWKSMTDALVLAAAAESIELKGVDLTAELPGFYGYQMSIDSQSAAADVAKGLRLLGKRIVILMMFHKRNRLVLCECHKLGYTNVIWMVMGWLPAGWWGIADTDCAAADVTQMATGFIGANMQFWRSDMSARLDCSSSMTAEGFRQEWLRRQNTSLDNLNLRPEGYVPALEAATTADAVCMYAQMLHELLVLQQLPLQSLSQRTSQAYAKIQDTFASTNFEGVAGTVKFGPNKADPDGSIIVQQMQNGGSIVDIATYSQGRLVFLGLNNLVFGLPNETFFVGPAGATSISGRAASFKTCQGNLRLNTASNTCETCPPEQVFIDVVGACTCKQGFAANGTDCVLCAPGTFSGTSGRVVCDDCPIGRFAATSGKTKCDRCQKGTFAGSRGMPECTRCPATRTTMSEGMESVSDCVCGAGTRPGHNKACEHCEISSSSGLLCLGNNEVKIAQGFYAADSTFSVFRCFGDPLVGDGSRCLEGYPGSNCAAGRTGISCSQCMLNTKKHNDGTCKPCDTKTLTTAVLVCGCIAVVIVLVLIYIAIDRRGSSQTSHSVMLCGLAFTMTITMVQQLSIVGMFKRVKWPEPMNYFMSWTQLITLDVEILDLSCIVSVSPFSHFAGRLSMIAICICVILLIHALWVPIAHKGNFRTSFAPLIACVGTLVLIFYISVISTVTGPLQCLKHPNGLSTAVAYESTICWETEEHLAMVWLGIVALMIPLAFLAKCCHAVWVFSAEMQAGQVGFLQAYAFLFSRYKTETYWYGLVHMFRSLFLAIVPILPNVSVQLLFMQAALLLSLICNVAYKPWRVPITNIVDAFFTVAIMCVIGCAGFYTDSDPSAVLAWVSVIIVCGAMVFFPAILVFSLYNHFFRKRKKPFQFFLCHHKTGAGSFARLMKMELEHSKTVTRDVFLDCDHLMDLEVLFDQVASLTETLVIVASKEIFTRLWCVGEITTANMKGLNVFKIALPDFEELTDDFIDNYDFYVPDLSILTTNSISLEHAQKAMRWCRGLDTLKVPPNLSNEIVADITKQITVGAGVSRTTTPHWKESPDGDATTFIICDWTSTEATSAALILERLLRPLFAHTPQELPHVLLSGGQVPPTAQSVLLMCTPGVLQQEDVLRALVAAAKLQAVCFPIVADASFSFPTASSVAEYSELLAKVHDNAAEVESLASEIVDIFRTIAVHLPASSGSQTVLDTQAQEIARRLRCATGSPITRTPSQSLRDVALKASPRSAQSDASSCELQLGLEQSTDCDQPEKAPILTVTQMRLTALL